MNTAKTSFALRSDDYNPVIAKKYGGLNFRKAKELPIDDEIFERVFNVICRHPFFGEINPNFTEATRNISISLSRSSFIDINRFHGEGTAEESMAYEFAHEFLRVLIHELSSIGIARNASYKINAFQSEELLTDLLKKVTSDNILIVSPVIATLMQANGILGNSIALPELMLMPTNLSNVFVDSYAVKNSVLMFDPSKVVFDFSEITIFQYRSNKTEDEDPVRIKVEGGIHPRIESYNANINETVYDLLDVSPRPWSEVYG
jgi:hypothetical protein